MPEKFKVECNSHPKCDIRSLWYGDELAGWIETNSGRFVPETGFTWSPEALEEIARICRKVADRPVVL